MSGCEARANFHRERTLFLKLPAHFSKLLSACANIAHKFTMEVSESLCLLQRANITGIHTKAAGILQKCGVLSGAGGGSGCTLSAPTSNQLQCLFNNIAFTSHLRLTQSSPVSASYPEPSGRAVAW